MSLHRVLLSLGLVIVLAGLIILLATGLFTDVEKVEVAKSSQSWEATANLTEGKTYALNVFSSVQWRDSWTDGEYEDPQPVDLVIASPNHNITRLQAFFVARLSTSPAYKSTFPTMVYVEYETVDSDSMAVDPTYPQVGFRVKQSGNYTAILIEDSLYWAIGPPKEMIFYEVITKGQGIYSVLLPGSAVVCISAGAALSVWGARATEKRTRRKKKIKK